MGLGSTLLEFFAAGLATPLTTACALPLYPGFVVYLSNQADEDGGGYSPALLGVLVLAGVLAFMFGVGMLFSYVLGESLTGVIGVVSPVAFGLLAVVSVALILDLDVFSSLPAVDPPQDRHPVVTAFGYGFFFGAIVIPCNPGTLTFLLARQFLVTAPVEKLLGFLAFGLGIGLPLLALAALSESFGRRITRTLARNRTWVNRAAGVVMLAVSVYYLVEVFDVFGLGGTLPAV